ncbi:MAG: helix-turn-helix transcriptional regulator [Verrucomicrobia bacterium]|nr:helix-turn-helix transcriptional regulator [Verrucomicrobiota bacterium]
MTHREFMLLRPSRTPSVALPLAARSVGHNWHLPHKHSVTKRLDFVQVLWGIRGTGVIVMEGIERRLGPGQLGLYFPGNEHHYFSLDEPWEVRWWTMDGPLAASNTAALGLATGRIYQAGPAPDTLFRKLERAMRDVSPAGEYRASTLAYELLVQAARGRIRTATDQAVLEAVDIIHARWSDPRLGVGEIARQLRMHRSMLARRFRAALGVAPINYLINLRVQNALNRLKAHSQPVNEVAYGCGWTDPHYFSRCIRRATGLSPKEFRQH